MSARERRRRNRRTLKSKARFAHDMHGRKSYNDPWKPMPKDGRGIEHLEASKSLNSLGQYFETWLKSTGGFNDRS